MHYFRQTLLSEGARKCVFAQIRRVLSCTGFLLGCTAAPVETTTGIEYHPTSSSTTPQPTLATSTGSISSSSDSTTDDTLDSTTSTSQASTTTVPDFGELGRDCNGQIDFLFVINRAHYMEPYWERFHAAFPQFIDNVFETFANYDMHFMAIDGTQGWGVFECVEQCEQTNGTCELVPGFPCDPYLNDTVSECDGVYGAGVVFPAGFGAANHDCGALPGRRFISADQPGALDSVKCIGQMGYGTSTALATASMLEAVKQDSLGWECNGSFIRDDAMLVVVYLEEADGPPCKASGSPGEWAEIIYEAKGGDEDRVMFIGLIEDSASELPTVCPGSGTENYGYCPAEFLHFYIKHRIEGSYCADDYGPYFEAGLKMLENLCDPDIPT